MTYSSVGLTNDDARISAVRGANLAALQDLADRWLDGFNMARLPFHLAGFEPIPDHRDTRRA